MTSKLEEWRALANWDEGVYPSNCRNALLEACDRIGELERKFDRQIVRESDLLSMLGFVQEERGQLKARVAKLEEALKYYADPETYEDRYREQRSPIDNPCTGPAILEDDGKRARAALEGTNGA